MLSDLLVPPDLRAAPARIAGTGEMADLIRSKDWGQTPLGPLEGWSDTLIGTVNLLLLSPFSFAVFWGSEHTLLYNDTYRAFLGQKHPQALGSPGAEVWNEAWLVIGPPITAAALYGKVTNSSDVFIPVLLDGRLQERWWTYCFYPIYHNGRIAGVTNIGHDSTPAVLAHRSMVESDARSTALSMQLSQILDATTEAIVMVDCNWVMTYFNPKAARLYGAEENRLIGRTVWEAFPEAAQSGSPYREYYQRTMQDRVSSSFEAHYSEPLNTWLRLEVHPTPDGIVIFSRDISEQKRTTAALIQSEKLAAMGRLASSIAHEINNPLESVTNLLYLARSSGDVAEIQDYLSIAERELRRVSAIAGQTLRFHKQSTKPHPTTCSDLFQSALSVYQGRLVNSGIEVRKRKRARLPIDCFEGEIRQVLSNLIANAIDAMHPHGGRLYVRSREQTDWRSGRHGIALTVADTGTGISSAVRERVFEAFYTTKGIGGTGLGLWLSKEIVERHHGFLRFRTSQREGSHGTVFTLFLPFVAVTR